MTSIDLSTYPFTSPLLRELQWRGLIHQITDPVELDAHLADAASRPRSVYAGFDPTSDSLTIGNLVPMMMLLHVARHGHRAVAVQGGATGLIGDPSGKTAERQLQTPETVRARVEAQRPIFGRVWSNARVREDRELSDPLILDNMDWIGRLSWVEALRDVGKHFSVNMMIQKDSVRERLNSRDQGISYTEFSYMLLQAYDFLHLFEKQGVTVQMGGSDQFGNIVTGIELIRRVGFDLHIAMTSRPQYFDELSESDQAKFERTSEDARRRFYGPTSIQQARSAAQEKQKLSDDELAAIADPTDMERLIASLAGVGPTRWFALGLTAPLVTKADGTKFGKTEGGAIWLSARAGPHDTSPARTSPYAYYQFWLNALDADVIRYLKIYTLLSREEIDELTRSHAANPGAREAHRALAREATVILHGRSAMEMAEKAASALFSGDIAGLDADTLTEALAGAPSSTLARARLDGPGLPLVDLLVEIGLAKSKREAREFLDGGSVQVSGNKAGAADAALPHMLLHGSLLPVRRGKKTWHVVRFQ
ncbi:MAG: tyrosine--tRNA ligase [Phycisphaerales bacterium]|nr:tyrosine--tRNA ligase [Phycisphaerales bacterium]